MRFALGSPRLGFSAHFWPPSSHIASELTFLLNSAGLLPPPQVVDSSLGCLSRCIPPLVVAELPSAPGQVQSSGQDKHSVAHPLRRKTRTRKLGTKVEPRWMRDEVARAHIPR